ncbi:Nitrogen permease regulator 2, partial [Serendipita sp. 399]
MHIASVFYAIFHPKKGPRIIFQVPENLITTASPTKTSTTTAGVEGGTTATANGDQEVVKDAPPMPSDTRLDSKNNNTNSTNNSMGRSSLEGGQYALKSQSTVMESRSSLGSSTSSSTTATTSTTSPSNPSRKPSISPNRTTATTNNAVSPTTNSAAPTLFEWELVSQFVIPRLDMCGRLTIFTMRKHRIVGFPVLIWDDKKYERGFQFNINSWDVPVPLIDITKRVEPNWDLTMRKVVPFINGVDHVRKIAQKAEADIDLVKECMAQVMMYQCVMMIDIFQFSNIYTLCRPVMWLFSDPAIYEECGPYVHKGEGEIPPWPRLAWWYARLKPPLTVGKWISQYGIDLEQIDVRRFVTFGIIKGFLRRVHRWPILLKDDKAPLPHSYITLKRRNRSITVAPILGKKNPGGNEHDLQPSNISVHSGFSEPPPNLGSAMNAITQDVNTNPQSNGDGGGGGPGVEEPRDDGTMDPGKFAAEVARRFPGAGVGAGSSAGGVGEPKGVAMTKHQKMGGISASIPNSYVSASVLKARFGDGAASSVDESDDGKDPQALSLPIAQELAEQAYNQGQAVAKKKLEGNANNAAASGGLVVEIPPELSELLDGTHHIDELCVHFGFSWSVLQATLRVVGGGSGDDEDFGRVVVLLRYAAASRLQRAQSKFESLAENARRDIASRLRTELSLRSRAEAMGGDPIDARVGDAREDALEREAENALSAVRLKAEKLLADDEAMDLMNILERYCDILMESRMERTTGLTELLSATSPIPIVDKAMLRRLCSHGIPIQGTAWLRLRSWSLLLGVLPMDKTLWFSVLEKGKNDYTTLRTQIERSLESYPLPGLESGSLSSQDRMLIQFGKDIEGLPQPLRDYFVDLESVEHAKSLVTSTTSVISTRLASLNALKFQETKARHTLNEADIPSITLDDNTQAQEQPTTVLSSQQSRGYWKPILLRMLYVHGSLHASHAHPMGPSQALASIFATVLILALQERQEASNDVYADSEALESSESHVFWLVEAIIGSVRELVETSEEDGEMWPSKFSAMVKWADIELWNDLQRKGLDPSQPYYSYRWIPTLLTHAVPIPVLLPLWDAMFSVTSTLPLPPSNSSSQSLFVYSIGTTMLIRSRGTIFHGGSAVASKEGTGASTPNALTTFWRRQSKMAKEIQIPHTPSTYSPIASPQTPSSPTMSAKAVAGWAGSHGVIGPIPHTPGAMGNIFLVTLRLLQEYDVDAFGGTERLLDTTWSIWRRWCREGGSLNVYEQNASLEAPQNPTGRRLSSGEGGVAASLGRFRELAWKGLTNDISDGSASPSPEPTPIEPSPKPMPPPVVTVTSPTEGKGAGFFSSIMNSKIAENAWKGMINQLDSPDPSPEVSPVSSPLRAEAPRAAPVRAVEPPWESVSRDRSESVTSGSGWSGEGATSWVRGYAERLRDSDTAASLSRTGTQLRARAAEMWSRTPTPTLEKQAMVATGQQHSPRRGAASVDLTTGMSSPISGQEKGHGSPGSSSIGSWSEMFSKRGSLPFVGSYVIGESRSGEGADNAPMQLSRSRESIGSARLEDPYSPPPKPAVFRAQRDSMIGSVLHSAGLSSPESNHPQRSPSSGDLASKSPLQAALAALTGSPTTDGGSSGASKRVPKPLLLNSSALMTPSGGRSGTNSRTPSRRPSPSPTPTPRASSNRFSVSTDDDSVAGATGFVSLRRGPITNPRTAGYGAIGAGGSASGRDGSHSSRASTS